MSNLEQGITHMESKFVSIHDLMLETITELRNNRRTEERGKAVVDLQQSPSSATTEKKGENSGTSKRDSGRFRRLELLVFSGEDSTGWMFKAERYFCINGLEEEEKLEATMVCMEGKALHWFLWSESRRPWRSWSELKRELVAQFHHLQNGDEYERLMALWKASTVSEYRENFVALFATIPGAAEEVLIGAFKNGLREEIYADLRLQSCVTLTEMMEHAQRIEERNGVVDQVQETKLIRGFRAGSTSNWVGSKGPNHTPGPHNPFSPPATLSL